MSVPNPNRPEEIAGVSLWEAYMYLDELRESGETNMYGAGPYLCEEFGISKRESHQILQVWTEDFSK